jgi:hypothetical protein
MKIQIEITEQELKDLKAIRNYFGEHDKTMFEHKAYAVLDRLVKLLATPAVSESEGLQGRELLLAEFYDYLLPYGQYPNVKELRINDFLSKQ